MDRRERIRFLLIWLCLCLLPLFLRPLWEPDEARYAEIPREMLALHDWLAPHLNHVLYFEKPPFQYWLSAASMKLFGWHAFAARLPLALASGISLWCAWRLARRLGASQPLWAAFMVATTILGFVSAQILNLDALFSALLVLSLVAFMEAVAADYAGETAWGWTLLAFGANALALLTKGLAAPVLLGGVIFWSLFWAWRDAELRRAVLRTCFDPLGWLLFAVIAAPWFILVEGAHPGHARFFFIHEHFARFSTTVHARQGSENAILDKLYFAGVLLVGLLPWLNASLLGLKRGAVFLRRRGPESPQAALNRWTVATLLLAFAVPLVFFSLSHSKLPQYILPALVPLAALACTFERDEEVWITLKRSGFELLFLGGLVLFAASFLFKGGQNHSWPLAVGCAFLLLGFWALRPRQLTGPRWMVGLGAAMLLLVPAATRLYGPGKDVLPLLRQAPANAQWISFGNYFQGLPFHTGQRVVVVAGIGELAYGMERLEPAERDRWFQVDPSQFNAVALRLKQESPDRPVYAMADQNDWKKLPEDQKQQWEVVGGTPLAFLLRLK